MRKKENKQMKLSKTIKTNYWYINRKPVALIWLLIALLYFVGTLLLNLINYL